MAIVPASEPNLNASPFLCITFFPSDRMATAVLRLVSSFCGMILDDANVSSRFYMAAHELAENITKYSTGPRVSLELALEDDREPPVSSKIRARNEAFSNAYGGGEAPARAEDDERSGEALRRAYP